MEILIRLIKNMLEFVGAILIARALKEMLELTFNINFYKNIRKQGGKRKCLRKIRV